jgi:hypothetical protein
MDKQPASGSRYPPNVRRRLMISVGGNLLLAMVWLGLWLWKPANWWNLLLCVLFAGVGLAILFDITRTAGGSVR